MIRIKRVYEEPAKDDGYRILVDRLWPRGLTKERAKVDLWMKEIAPSDALRKWFGHEAEKWPRVCETLSKRAIQEERLAERSEATGTRARLGDAAVRTKRRKAKSGGADCRGA